jgi:hypothetical protein
MVDRTMAIASRLGDTSFSVQIRTCELLKDNGQVARPLRDRRGQDHRRYGMGAPRLDIQDLTHWRTMKRCGQDPSVLYSKKSRNL